MQIAQEELVSALSSSQEVESLQKTIYQSDGNAILLEDRLESKENEQEKLVNRLALKKVMCELPDQEQKIIIMRYYSGQTQVQTAKCLGISHITFLSASRFTSFSCSFSFDSRRSSSKIALPSL